MEELLQEIEVPAELDERPVDVEAGGSGRRRERLDSDPEPEAPAVLRPPKRAVQGDISRF